MPRLPDAAEIAYMEAHINDTRVPDVIACTSICGIASIIFIVLRLISRRVAKGGMEASDWLILFAWVSLKIVAAASFNSSSATGNWAPALGTETRVKYQIRTAHD